MDDINIQTKIFTIRGLQVMLDRDLAELYEVETKVFNQAVKRNENRFPDDFRFQLTEAEYQNLRSQIMNLSEQNSLRSQSVTLKSNRGKHTKYLPYAFTEQGVSMLSAVLKSDMAVDISVKIIRSFVNMRKLISNNASLFQRVETLEQEQLTNDKKFNKLFDAIEQKDLKPTQGIFYDGQIFDAYVFVSDLIKSAKKEIVLIINKELYHIGASLKDLGKKWFAFSKMDKGSFEVLERIG